MNTISIPQRYLGRKSKWNNSGFFFNFTTMTSSDNSKHKLIRVLTEFNYYNKYPWLEDEELIPIVKNMLKKNENYTTTTSQEIDVDISMEMYEFTTKADLEEA